MQNELDNVVVDEDEEIPRFKNHSQISSTQIKKLKNEKQSQQETLEQLTIKEFMIDKETMIDLIKIEKSSNIQIQTLENGPT